MVFSSRVNFEMACPSLDTIVLLDFHHIRDKKMEITICIEI